MAKPANIIERFLNTGNTDDLPFRERKKNRILNLVGLLSLPYIIILMMINLYQEHYEVVLINIIPLVSWSTFFAINYYRKFMTARLTLNVLSIFFIGILAVCFRNGAEYFLITNVIVIPILFNDRWMISITSALNIGMFLSIKLFDTSAWVIDPMPASRTYINMTMALITVSIAVQYLKMEYRRFEQELEGGKRDLSQKNEQLKVLNTNKEKLFSIIAHDLRSPIAQLRGSLDLMNRKALTPEQFRGLSENLSEQVNELQSSLETLLTWSYSQLQGIEATPKLVRPEETIDQVLALLKTNIDSKQIRVHRHIKDLPVFADPDHLLLILRNLISNAIKYSYPAGDIFLTGFRKDQFVILAVADNGSGIDGATKSALFDSYHVVSKRGTLNEKGTGLGLKLCREFIVRNGGKIWVESEEKKGSTFFISLPAGK